MKGLLVKDFCLIRQQKKFLAILLLLAIVLNYNSDGSFVIGYLTFVCSFLIISSISYDEYDNGYSFLFTLPVGRKTYVQSKYIFAVLLSSCSWITGCVIASVFYLARNQVGRLWGSLAEARVLLLAILVFLAIVLPLQFKFGAEKGKYAILATFGICFVIGYLGKTISDSLGIHPERIFNRLLVQNSWVLGGILLLGTVFILGISYLFSVAILKQKEF